MDTKNSLLCQNMPNYCGFASFTCLRIKGQNFAKNGTTFPIVVVKLVVKRDFPTTEIFLG